MKRIHILSCSFLAIALSGCASIFEGTTQKITVVTNPPGATCSFERQGKQIATVASTPATANIRKTKHDITIYCEKPGYQRAEYLNHSGTTAVIAANIVADVVFTAGLSSIIDSARGADNKYDSAVNITLVPIQPTAPAPVGVQASSPPPSLPAPSSLQSISAH
jgi:hypothetical protein